MGNYLRLSGVVLALLLWTQPVQAQCTGVFPAKTLCGNLGATAAAPKPFPASGTVIGPVSSTVGHFATWANTTGTQLADFDLFGTGNTWTGVQTFNSVVVTTADINGGTIDGTSVGASSASTGRFTTLTTTTSFTSSNVIVTGGTINGTVIGGVTPAAATFSTLAFTTLSSNVPLANLPLTSGNMIVGNGSNVGASVAMSGDCTITNAGVVTCNGYGAWTAYTPTLTCQSGTLTSASASGRYKTFGKSVMFTVSISVTTAGTCSGAILATLPFNVLTGGVGAVMAGQNLSTQATFSCYAAAAGSTASCSSTGSIPIGSGVTGVFTGVYERN